MQTFFHHVPLDRWCKSLAFHFTTKQFQCSCQDHLTQRCTQICANRCAGVVHSDLQSSEYKLPRTACMIPRFTLQRKETSNGKRPFSVYFSVCLQDPLFVVYKTHCLFTQPIVCLQNPLYLRNPRCHREGRQWTRIRTTAYVRRKMWVVIITMVINALHELYMSLKTTDAWKRHPLDAWKRHRVSVGGKVWHTAPIFQSMQGCAAQSTSHALSPHQVIWWCLRREVATFAWTAEGRLARSLEQLKGGWHVRLNSWREVDTFAWTAEGRLGRSLEQRLV